MSAIFKDTGKHRECTLAMGLAYDRGGGGGGGGVERPIHFHCILHAKRRGGGGSR